MNRFRLTHRADLDVDGIWLSIAQHNLRAADKLSRRLNDAFALLARWPGIGEARPDLGTNYRVFSVAKYAVVFRPVDGGVEIIRVIHGARDIRALF